MTTRTARLFGAFVACSLAFAACEEPGLPFPESAVDFTPPAQYQLWWSAVETCSGVHAPIGQVQWKKVPGVQFYPRNGNQVAGTWFPGNTIVLAEGALDQGRVVRHEMLHSLIGTGAHPFDAFVKQCGHLLTCFGDCPDVARDTLPPATASVGKLEDLTVTVSVDPSSITDATNGWALVTVVAQPTTTGDVWIPLSSPDGSGEVPVFGFGAGDKAIGASLGAIEYRAISRLGFPAGEAKRYVFDVRLTEPGATQIWGILNTTTSVPVPVTRH